MLTPGDPVPPFRARSGANPAYAFDSVAGRHVAVTLIGRHAVPGMAAIRNAVYQAIGIRFNHLPMSPPKVLDALESVALRKAAD